MCMKRSLLLVLVLMAAAFQICCTDAVSPAAVSEPMQSAIVTPYSSQFQTPSPSNRPNRSSTPSLIPVTLFLPGPDKNSVSQKTVSLASVTPRSLLLALAQAGAIPEADYAKDYAYFEIGEGTAMVDGKKMECRVVRADLPDAFGNGIKAIGEPAYERCVIQSLVDTFLTYYSADAFVLTIEGTRLETHSRVDYEEALLLHQLVPVAEDTVRTPSPEIQ